MFHPINLKFLLVDWLVLRNLSELWGFLGVIGNYRQFVQNYATIASHSTDLLKKDSFSMSSTSQRSFEALKQAVTITPIFALPDFPNHLFCKLMFHVWVLAWFYYDQKIHRLF